MDISYSAREDRFRLTSERVQKSTNSFRKTILFLTVTPLSLFFGIYLTIARESLIWIPLMMGGGWVGRKYIQT